jgi:hypothetical protein
VVTDYIALKPDQASLLAESCPLSDRGEGWFQRGRNDCLKAANTRRTISTFSRDIAYSRSPAASSATMSLQQKEG